ncbi:MAG: sodium-dependent transporter, partial [Bdellovibrionales bacterium]|nr:sodium-dependent transporter [Bdellovibrionales bacterium]
MKKGGWGTRFGFYLAAIGSAFGLGNIWRFPYILSQNGGGAFVFLYLFLVFVIGMPLLIGELLLGKVERKSVFSALKSLSQQPLAVLSEHPTPYSKLKAYLLKSLPWIGRLSIFLCVLVLAYYSVISGWVLYYLMRIFGLFFHEGTGGVHNILPDLMGSPTSQICFTLLHLSVVTYIVAKDIEEGLEKFVGYMVPVFLILLIVLATKSLSLESAPEAL